MTSTESELYLNVKQYVEKTLYLDESRTQFCKTVCKKIEQLQDGQLYKRTHFHRLLLGRKNVGKTSLLDLLQEAVAKYTTVKIVFITYENPTDSELPLDYVADALDLCSEWDTIKRAHKTMNHVKAFHTLLREKGIKVFVVVDEVQNVYGAACKNGEAIIGQLGAIGGCSLGVSYWVLSGSSTHLRELVTAKLPYPNPRFPNYKCLDLNGTKFQPVFIYPLYTKEDISAFCDRFPGEGKKSERYFRSGGMPSRLIDEAEDSWGLSFRNLVSKPEVHKLVLKMYEVLVLVKPESASAPKKIMTVEATEATAAGGNASHASNDDSIDDSNDDSGDEDDKLLEFYCTFTKFIPLSYVIPSGSEEPLCYELADAGIIRFENKTTDTARIGFAHPSFTKAIDMSSSFVPLEILYAFKHPSKFNSDNDPAGNFTLKFLVDKGVSLFGVNLSLGPRGLQELDLRGSPEFEYGCMYKEFPDEYGADGVFVMKSSDELMVHRIQVKLGDKPLDATELKDICDKLKAHKTQVDTYFKKRLEKVEQRWYLATTRELKVPANEVPKCITLFDRKKLSVIWPPVIKALKGVYK